MRTLVKDGEIKHVRLGKRIYVTRDQIDELLQDNAHAGYEGRWMQ